jgi:hypothetical protein
MRTSFFLKGFILSTTLLLPFNPRIFCETVFSINDLLGAWNIGVIEKWEKVKDMEGNEYWGDYKTVFIEKNISENNSVYWNNVKLNSVNGTNTQAVVDMELFFDITKQKSWKFKTIFHFISYNQFWIEVQENGFSKKELKMFRSYVKDGKKQLYTRAKKVQDDIK